MCYLVAKKRFGNGSIAVKTCHGKELVGFMRTINNKILDKNIQLVTVSKLSAYNEYAPYKVVDNNTIFEREIEKL